MLLYGLMGWAILPENVCQNNPFIGMGTRVTEVETQNPPTHSLKYKQTA